MGLLFPVDSPLSSLQLASILEAGVTYILYQRGQIPLPYQQLQLSALEQKKLEDAVNQVNLKGQVTTIAKNSSRTGSAEQRSPNQQSVNEAVAKVEMNPRERISTMLLERKKRILQGKVERQKRLAVALESKAYNSIQSALEVLKRLLVDISRNNLGRTSCGLPKKIVSTALVLGPSLYCSKEVYCFDMPFPCLSDDSNLISKGLSNQFENQILRQFYKRIITDSDLMDFTSKPLAKTYAHICLVTLGDLNSVIHGNSHYKDVIRLPTIPPTIHQLISNSKNNESNEETDLTLQSRSNACSTASKRKANKCFKFRIQYRDHSIPNNDSIDVTHGSMENNKSGSFSGDILFDNNSFSCYQIPLRFKGVQCKNKRL